MLQAAGPVVTMTGVVQAHIQVPDHLVDSHAFHPVEVVRPGHDPCHWGPGISAACH